MKLEIVNKFSGHTANFKIGVTKVQDFGYFELSPMYTICVKKYPSCLHYAVTAQVFLLPIHGNHGGSRRGDRGSGLPPPPPEKSQNIGFLSNTGPDPRK